jgi:Domain of Unknown Function (DUF928)
MLKTIRCLVSSIGLATILLPSIGLAQARIVYNPPPPKTEAPRKSEISATRGCDKDLIGSVTLFAPTDHTGLTTLARPTLLYSITKSISVPVILTVAAIDGREALVERQIVTNPPGIKNFLLPPDVELEPNKEYVWTITLVCNPAKPSQDVNIQRGIRRVAVTPELNKQLSLANSPRDRSWVYARDGIWYDAIASASSEDWQDLLDQIGLSAREKSNQTK